MSLIENVSRRDFVKTAGVAAGFAVGVTLDPTGKLNPFVREAQAAEGVPSGAGTLNPNLFVTIDKDGTVYIVCHRSEMGQGIRTGTPVVLADELEADWGRCRVVQAVGDKMYGNQYTDGSRSVRHNYARMREFGATTRAMLEKAAAIKWGVSESECKAQNHKVMGPGGKSADFGELVEIASGLPVPDVKSVKLKDPSEFRYIGRDIPLVDGPNMSVGKAIYGMDLRLPGMVYSVVEHCPVTYGKVKSVDASETMKVPGVIKVVEIPQSAPPIGFNSLGGVAVIANSTWAANEGRKKLKIDWDYGANTVYNSEDFRVSMENTAKGDGNKVVRQEGDVAAALAGADKVLEATFYVPHFAHAMMEPPVALARVKDGKCDVWGGYQDPQAARGTVAKAIGMDEADVTTHVALLGGGFGRRSKPDFAAEAAILAKQLGVPVKNVWTREDDIQHAYYHTVCAQHIKAGLKDGKVTGWLHRSVFPTIWSTFEDDPQLGHKIELSLGFLDLPYNIPNLQLENGKAKAHVRIGWLRSVNNIPHAFAQNTMANMLAEAAGQDPVKFLADLIGPDRTVDLSKADYWNYDQTYDEYPIMTSRLKGVLEVAANASGYGKKLGEREAIGIAVHRSFTTYVATAIHARIGADGKLSIPRVDVAVDAGRCVNTDRVRSQMEGSCIYGLTGAYYSEISAKGGVVQQSNFHDYSMVRMPEAPREINVHIVNNTEKFPPGGVGEPGVPPFAPALTNAIYAATGKRIFNLPISKHNLAA
jgi:isoquinoline 1-oxidoreductase beta subunit